MTDIAATNTHAFQADAHDHHDDADHQMGFFTRPIIKTSARFI
jgi:hypothetical protein